MVHVEPLTNALSRRERGRKKEGWQKNGMEQVKKKNERNLELGKNYE